MSAYGISGYHRTTPPETPTRLVNITVSTFLISAIALAIFSTPICVGAFAIASLSICILSTLICITTFFLAVHATNKEINRRADDLEAFERARSEHRRRDILGDDFERVIRPPSYERVGHRLYHEHRMASELSSTLSDDYAADRDGMFQIYRNELRDFTSNQASITLPTFASLAPLYSDDLNLSITNELLFEEFRKCRTSITDALSNAEVFLNYARTNLQEAATINDTMNSLKDLPGSQSVTIIKERADTVTQNSALPEIIHSLINDYKSSMSAFEDSIRLARHKKGELEALEREIAKRNIQSKVTQTISAAEAARLTQTPAAAAASSEPADKLPIYHLDGQWNQCALSCDKFVKPLFIRDSRCSYESDEYLQLVEFWKEKEDRKPFTDPLTNKPIDPDSYIENKDLLHEIPACRITGELYQAPYICLETGLTFDLAGLQSGKSPLNNEGKPLFKPGPYTFYPNHSMYQRLGINLPNNSTPEWVINIDA